VFALPLYELLPEIKTVESPIPLVRAVYTPRVISLPCTAYQVGFTPMPTLVVPVGIFKTTASASFLIVTSEELPCPVRISPSAAV
jgi:hypothetical protein